LASLSTRHGFLKIEKAQFKFALIGTDVMANQARASESDVGSGGLCDPDRNILEAAKACLQERTKIR